MRIAVLLTGLSMVATSNPDPVLAQDPGRVYGRITTLDGEVFQGLIRWDKNEASWADVLHGSKELQNLLSEDREGRSVRLSRLRIDWDRDDDWPRSAASGVRLGHLSRIEVLSDHAALLVFKSGEEVEFSSGSTDLGDGVREIVIEDDDEGLIELGWHDLDQIEFLETPGGLESRLGQRLYGTVTTRDGLQFDGYVAWDMDEVLTSDILDGEERGRDRKIDFARIRAVERQGSRSALVILTTGKEVELSGSNDVNDDNRGIVISDPGLGLVRVDWDGLDRVEFRDELPELGYDRFDGGWRIRGTVHTRDGESYTGEIRWDNDEEYSWEFLNGETRTAEFEIEFSKIASLTRASSRAATVELWDGRSFELRGSNDVDRDNKGIFIEQSDGEVVAIGWNELDRVEFQR